MKLSISGRMLMCVGAVFLLCLALSATSFLGLNQVIRYTRDLTEGEVNFLILADTVQIQMLQHRRFEKDFFLNIGKPDKQANYLQDFAKKSGELQKSISELNEVIRTLDGIDQEFSTRVASLVDLYAAYRQGFAGVVVAIKADPKITPQYANKLMAPYKKSIHHLEGNIDAAFEAGKAHLRKAIEANRTYSARLRLIAIILSLICLGFVAGAGWWISRWTKRDLSRIVGRLEKNAGDLGQASHNVAATTQEIAQGSNEQAASLEQTAASLEELSSMTSQNADNAAQADQLMAETTREVEQANASMKELRGSMEKINQASNETAKIIKSIDEIAFQTNLLALNAAVEAARAGEAGAGFAVVADEVRNLAMRAAEAARNTGSMIQENIANLNSSTQLVIKTDEAFDRVEERSRKVAQLVGEIAAASNEQSQGISAINQGVTEMEEVTSRNAAAAEEFSVTVNEMDLQAAAMMEAARDLRELALGERETGMQKLLPQKSG